MKECSCAPDLEFYNPLKPFKGREVDCLFMHKFINNYLLAAKVRYGRRFRDDGTFSKSIVFRNKEYHEET